MVLSGLVSVGIGILLYGSLPMVRVVSARNVDRRRIGSDMADVRHSAAAPVDLARAIPSYVGARPAGLL